ncbi:Na(+)-translocating NADH-quinone reductase subunit C [Oceanobacter kriegii]|uniref:Na(+)-translocating NADH-quinone reductase subunit C n=1 Tax=Oceanobacter kriegii TaxID=64972 RepID=UPI00040F7285|nr:Na(+)-translocating NADH-quinone reductase subunit C [Oceanobacter kriegii]
MSANNDSIQKTLLVAVLLCLVCSVIVAGAAVGLRPQQNENKANDKRAAVLQAAGLYDASQSIASQFEDKITTRIVNVKENRFATDAEMAELKTAGLIDQYGVFNQQKSAKMPEFSNALPGDEDIASIKRLEDFAAVYIVGDENNIDKIILPVHGYGLWSTLYGFLALEGDMDTIVGLGFYSHAETPGLGGEVDNPKWKAQWVGKEVFDKDGDIAITVVKGGAQPGNPYQVDGLSGATLTSRGVDNLVRFWVGSKGFGGLLDNLKGQGA